MSDDYSKQLEEENEKLRSLLSEEQINSDKYKMYYDLIRDGDIIHAESDHTWDGELMSQRITISMKAKDFDVYDMIELKIDERNRQLRKLEAIRDENELLREKIWHYLKIAGIVAGSLLLLYGCGWGIYYAWFFVP